MATPDAPLLDQATYQQYSAALDAHEKIRADLVSRQLLELLGQEKIPIRRIMVSAFHQAGHTAGELVVVLEGPVENKLIKRLLGVTEELLSKPENSGIVLFPLSNADARALDPDHYFSGYRIVLP